MAQKVEPQMMEAMAKSAEEGIAKVYVLSQFLVGMNMAGRLDGGTGQRVRTAQVIPADTQARRWAPCAHA
ncbi:hypothetical protein GCM10027318_39380 [Massilia agilis]